MQTGPHTVSLIAYKAGADVVSKAVTLAITVSAARLLSTGDFGLLALAMTTGWLLSVASDAGLPLYLAKRIARQTAAGERVSFAPVLEALRVRGVLGTIGSVVGLAVAVFVAPGSTFFAFWLIVLSQILNAVLETLAHAYRGLGRTDIESTILISQRLITAMAAIVVLLATESLLLHGGVLVVVTAVALMASIRTARHVLAYEQEPIAEPSPAGATPLSHARVGLAVLISALYFRCDVFFIERWHGLETVGVYNAAFRIVEALRLFPAAVLAVSFPALCTTLDLRLLRSLLKPLVGTAILAAGAVYVLAPFVLVTLYGARFVDGAPALATLALALPFFFGNYALTHQVIAWDGQAEYLLIVSAALVTNVAGNLLLIPRGGMQGAAISTLVTEIVVAAGCVFVLARRRHPLGSVGAGSSAGAAS
jgi:O-antigen/teichoic acid export membrane protein